MFIIMFSAVILVLNANSVDPDQTPCSVASDLGIYCLTMSLSINGLERHHVACIYSIVNAI